GGLGGRPLPRPGVVAGGAALRQRHRPDRGGDGGCVPSGGREALAAHATDGADQQAMVREARHGGGGAAVVVGWAGTGKTFALGIALPTPAAPACVNAPAVRMEMVEVE